ncbi:MAG TPA: hypothetical protein VMV40_05255 [Acidiferrobacter sp.]|nr:hypothetical protein [Acidiferrobacter sp.]
MRLTVAFLIVAALPLVAHAKDPMSAGVAIPNNMAQLTGQTLASGRGVASMNEAAGSNNIQVNADAVALGGHVAGVIHQQASASGSVGSLGTATIDGNAFANFSGILNINQAAGNNNIEANSVAIATSPRPLAASELGQVAPAIVQDNTSPVSDGGAAQIRKVIVGGSAMGAVSGIAQVSQTSGSGNILSNSIGLSFSAGAIP